MTSEDDFRRAYFDECAELIEELELGLTALDEGRRDSDVIDAVFRAVHSIKGGAGMFALDELVRFAHCFETTFDMVRDGALALDRNNIRLFLQSADMLSALVDATRDEMDLPADRRPGSEALSRPWPAVRPSCGTEGAECIVRRMTGKMDSVSSMIPNRHQRG
ncbi:MAG: Hpt domain-containing protein [Geminicoccaceae bacterium]